MRSVCDSVGSAVRSKCRHLLVFKGITSMIALKNLTLGATGVLFISESDWPIEEPDEKAHDTSDSLESYVHIQYTRCMHM